MNATRPDERKSPAPLRRGWTTGACAAAAARAAASFLGFGAFPDPVEIVLPGGQRPAFSLARSGFGPGFASASVIKDAGDDPDITHGVLVSARVTPLAAGAGLVFCAGPGVGTVTRPGLPLPVGEAAINPVPRRIIRDNLALALAGGSLDFRIEIGIEHGEELALKTLNPRLGIVGGLSVLGTTGIVVPYSCAAWIASIHRGIDVARAAGLDHLAAATGSTSEKAVQALYALPDAALIDMGDFVGGTVRYFNRHPVRRLTVAGGFAKMTKLAEGRLDLHSRAGEVNLAALADWALGAGAPPDLAGRIAAANTALEALNLATAAGIALPALVAARALATLSAEITADIAVDVAIFDRQGALLATAGA